MHEKQINIPIKLINPNKYIVPEYYKLSKTIEPIAGPKPSPTPTTISI